jgi:hypothetical protein
MNVQSSNEHDERCPWPVKMNTMDGIGIVKSIADERTTVAGGRI